MIYDRPIFDKKIEKKEGFGETKCPQNGVVRKHARIPGEKCIHDASAKCPHGDRIAAHSAMQGQKTGSFQVAFDGTSSSS